MHTGRSTGHAYPHTGHEKLLLDMPGHATGQSGDHSEWIAHLACAQDAQKLQGKCTPLVCHLILLASMLSDFNTSHAVPPTDCLMPVYIAHLRCMQHV
jgi:hypothetical protein